MKKVFALILVLAMALTLWACSLFTTNDIGYKPLGPDTQEEAGGNNTESGSTPAESVPDTSANNVTPSQGSSSSGNNDGGNSSSTTTDSLCYVATVLDTTVCYNLFTKFICAFSTIHNSCKLRYTDTSNNSGRTN